ADRPGHRPGVPARRRGAAKEKGLGAAVGKSPGPQAAAAAAEHQGGRDGGRRGRGADRGRRPGARRAPPAVGATAREDAGPRPAVVHPRAPEEWEYGFRCDRDPTQEIAVWLLIEKYFKHFTEGREVSPEKAKDIFQVILACVNQGGTNDPERVAYVTATTTLTKKKLREIVAYIGERGQRQREGT